MIRHINICWILFFSISLSAQHWERMDSLVLQDSVDQILYDNLSSQYILSGGSRIQKINTKGIRSYYQNNRLGMIGQVDIRDPMKVMLFYPIFQTILTLDNSLAQTGKLNFAGTSIGTVGAMCRAIDNQIWIYDLSNRCLNKIDPGGNLLIRGIPNYTIRLDPQLQVRLWQEGEYLMLWQPGLSVFLFDNFGKYIRELPLPTNSRLVGVKDYIYYISDGDLRAYDYSRFALEPDKVILTGIQPDERLAIDYTSNTIYKYDKNFKLQRWIP